MAGKEQRDQTANIANPPESERESPPKAPEFNPRLKHYTYQWIGIPILFLIPILALLNVFGVSTDVERTSSETVDVSVTYPTRFRYKQINTIDVAITNTSDSMLDSVLVQFERPYIDRFSDVTFTPDVKTITEPYYEVELTDIPPGETQHINVMIQAEDYGRHSGVITITPSTGDSLFVNLRTLSWP